MDNLNNRIAIVTGASAGMGLAFSRNFLEHGARVVVNARRKERLHELEKEWNQNSIRVLTVPGDAAEAKIITQMFDMAEQKFGQVPSIVVANAGRGIAGSVCTSDESAWEEMIRTNLLGVSRLVRETAARMTSFRAKDPHSPLDIVIMGSTVGRHISPFSSIYGSTKFAVNSLAEALRRELAPKNIRVSLIEPGIVVSEFQKVAGYNEEWGQFVSKWEPLLKPDDIARIVNFIISQPAHVHINDVVIRPTKQDYP